MKFKNNNLRDPEQIGLSEFVHLILKNQTLKATIIHPLRASKMKNLKHPAKPLFQNESDEDVTILSNEESDVEDYHIKQSALLSLLE